MNAPFSADVDVSAAFYVVRIDNLSQLFNAVFDAGRWPHETASNRARGLLKVADLIDRDRETLAILDTLESGKPIAQARGEFD